MVLNLAQVVAERTNSLRLLEGAYDSAVGIGRDGAVALDSMFETARSKGLAGSLELAVAVLRVSGRFRVERGPTGQWHVLRQSTALVPVAAQRTSRALVPMSPVKTIFGEMGG